MRSNDRLAPFKDPLLVDLGTHRWLSSAREEAYSDWLAWILQQLEKTPELVFSLFDLKSPVSTHGSAGVSLSVTREFWVSSGHDDHAGKLDLLIRYGNQALVCVEVKLGPADTADTEKQTGYRKYLDEQAEIPKESCHGVLLVTEASEKRYAGNFMPVRWSDVCLRLRRMVLVVKRNEAVVAAMILAFVGAVEQNLLRFSSAQIREAYAQKPVSLSSEIGNHIQGSLDEETRMANTAVPPNLPEAGISSYIEALIAVQKFQLEIQRISKKVVNERMRELMDAIGIEPDQVKPPEEYANPGDLKKWTGSDAWIAVRLRHPLFTGYFGWLWREHGEHVQAGVVATLAPKHPLHAQLLEAVGRNGIQNVYKTWGTEISLWEPISLGDVKNFGQRLDKLINDWIRVWTSVGGLKGLTGAGSSGAE